MNKLMNKLMLSCVRASELIEKKINSKLTTKEKIQLSLHTSMCDACHAWKKQSSDLDKTLSHHITNLPNPDPDSSTRIHLSHEAKKAILKYIKKNNR